MAWRRDRVLSLALRISALGARFLLFFWLAFYLSPADVGLYGLIAATVSYGTLFMGMDFHLFSNREFKRAALEDRWDILRASISTYLVIYVLAIPFLMIVFMADLLPWHIAGMFFAILTLEHIGQEIYRILVMMERVVLAGWVLFLRIGLWAIVVAILMMLDPRFQTMETVLIAWSIGALLAVVFAIPPLLELPRVRSVAKYGRNWVKSGFRVALPFLLGTLALRGMVVFDRYLIEFFASEDIQGVYVLFAGMAATLPALLEAGVFAFLSPKLIAAAKEQNRTGFALLVARMRRETNLAVAGFVILGVIGVQLVVAYLPNPIYGANMAVFYICLAAQIPLSMSMVFHFPLYAHGHHKPIIVTHILAFVVFISAAFAISLAAPLLAVPLALVVANTGLLIGKYAGYRAGVHCQT